MQPFFFAEYYVHGPAAGVDDPCSGSTAPRSAPPIPASCSPDVQGSIVAVADGAGSRLGVNRYDEYGIPASSNSGRFGYTGQIWLPELGMYHYKARINSPSGIPVTGISARRPPASRLRLNLVSEPN